MRDYEKFAELQDTAFQFMADSDTCGTVTKNEIWMYLYTELQL